MTTHPTPAEVFRGPRRPLTARPVATDAVEPAAPAMPPAAESARAYRLPAGTPWLRRYEVALRISPLHHNARHVALIYALAADWTTGIIAPGRTPGVPRLASLTGISEFYARLSRHALVDAGWIRRIPAASSSQVSHVVLLIPAGFDPVR